MGRHSREQAGEPDPVPLDQAGERPATAAGRPWWRKRVIWVGVATLLICPLLVHLGSDFIDRVMPSTPAPAVVLPPSRAQHNPKRKSDRTAPTPTSTQTSALAPAPTAPTPSPRHPLTVLSEDPVDPGNVVWTFRGSHILDQSRLSYIDHNKDAYQSNWLNDYLFSLHGFAPYADTQFVLEDNFPYDIQLTDMQVIDKTCTSPPYGTLVYAPDGITDPETQAGFDLSSQDNDVMLAKGQDVKDWRAGYFWNRTVVLKPGKALSFDVRAVAPDKACTFMYQMTIALPDGRNLYETISDDGQPFRVSSPPSSARYRPGGSDFSRYKTVFLGGVANPKKDGILVPEK